MKTIIKETIFSSLPILLMFCSLVLLASSVVTAEIWTDPVGDNVCLDGSTSPPEGDIRSSSAIVNENGEVELILQLGASPLTPSFINAEWFIDTDQNIQTGQSGGGVQGWEQVVTIRNIGELGTLTVELFPTGGIVCDNVGFNPDTNEIRIVIPAGLLGTTVFNYTVMVQTAQTVSCFDTSPNDQMTGVRLTSTNGPFLSTGFPELLCVTIKPPDFVAGGGHAQLADGSRAFMALFAGMPKDFTATPQSNVIGNLVYRDETVELNSTEPGGYVAPTPNSRRILYFGTINNPFNRARIFVTVHDNGGPGLDTFEIIVTNLQDGSVYSAKGVLEGGDFQIHTQ